jgi:hypothetical protein
MFAVPASAHFVVHSLLDYVQEPCHFGAVRVEEDQFATLPVLPSR